MAWNQPGGGQQNPWGRRPNQGGQDFDQAFSDWRKKFESIFRGGGGGGGGAGGGAAESRSMMFGVLALAVGAWLISGFFQIDQAERGIVQRFGKYVGERNPGLGWRVPWPVETVTKVNVANVNSEEYKSRVLTADLNLVELRLTVQYQLSKPRMILFNVRDPKATLREVSESAIREVIGRSDLVSVSFSNRQQITQRAKELIQRTLDQYGTGILVTTVNLTDVQVPEAVQPSQRDANKALADRERFVKEAEAYASGIVPVAEGAASRQIQEAEAYKSQVTAIAEGEAARFNQFAAAYASAPQVTRQRLYIETLETVLKGSRKVILDSKPGTGNMIYLPLDKLMERSARSPEEVAAAAAAAARAAAVQGEQESGGPDARQRGER